MNRPPSRPGKNKNVEQGKIFVFSAVSGAGKTTLLNHLKDSVPGLVYSISATTRRPRTGERNGVHYFFLTEDAFTRKRDAGEFAEWQTVHGHLYGTPKKFVDDVISSGRHIIMDIDVYGKKKFDAVYPGAVGILVLPPSLSIVEQRLRGRGTDDEPTIRLRLENARKEMAFAEKEGKYEHRIINDDLERAKNAVLELVRKYLDP